MNKYLQSYLSSLYAIQNSTKMYTHISKSLYVDFPFDTITKKISSLVVNKIELQNTAKLFAKTAYTYNRFGLELDKPFHISQILNSKNLNLSMMQISNTIKYLQLASPHLYENFASVLYNIPEDYSIDKVSTTPEEIISYINNKSQITKKHPRKFRKINIKKAIRLQNLNTSSPQNTMNVIDALIQSLTATVTIIPLEYKYVLIIIIVFLISYRLYCKGNST